MHQTETIRGTARKRGSAVRTHVSPERRDVNGGGKRKGPGLETNRALDRQKTPGRKRVETVVETLSALRTSGETLAEAAHDARNMVTALGLYCDLLEEPGVLANPFVHYGHELRLVAAASRRLVEKIAAIDAQMDSSAATATLPAGSIPGAAPRKPQIDGTAVLDRTSDQNPASLSHACRRWDLLPAMPVANLAAELIANRNLLAALAGPAIALTVDAEGGERPVRLTGEDLTRVLVNLVKNSAEAMPSGGSIHISLREEPPAHGAVACLLVTVEDNGPGIPPGALETIFASGYTSHGVSESPQGNWILGHRGLGLTITRSIVEGAGGRITAGNCEHGGRAFPWNCRCASQADVLEPSRRRRLGLSSETCSGPNTRNGADC